MDWSINKGKEERHVVKENIGIGWKRDIFLRAREERYKENGTDLLFFLRNIMGRSII
jgi:hypothetical protein